MGLGAYICSVLTVMLKLNLNVALLISSLATGSLGTLLAFPALRLKGLYLAIATIGLIEIFRVVFKNLAFIGGTAGFSGMVGTTLPLLYIWVGICLVIVWKIEKSRLGWSMKAVKQDEAVAEMMGLNTTYLKVVSFGIGAFMSALGGGLYAHYMYFIDPNAFGFERALIILLYLVFGGETMWGAVGGATILTILPELVPGLADWRIVFYGCILILVMNLRPQGLISEDLLRRSSSKMFAIKKSIAVRK